MSKRRSIVPRAAVVLATLLAAGPLGASRAQAVDAAAALAPIVAADSSAASRPAARSGEGDKVTHERKAQPAATQAGKSAAKPTQTAKKPKPPKPLQPPEKSYEEQKKLDGLWTKRTSWLSLRAGYAKSTADGAGNGLAGYGMAYQRMISNRWAFGAAVQHDVVGRVGTSSEISVPFTAELTRHFKMSGGFRPYLGFGGGYYFHKYYRTGGDTGSPGTGAYVTFGLNVPIDDRHLLGVDARASQVSGHSDTTNPVFGQESAGESLWSIKVSWTFTYFQ